MEAKRITSRRIGTWRRLGMVSALAIGALAVVPGVASAWSRWTGVDPIIPLSSGDNLAIRVLVPSEYACDLVSGDSIGIKVTLPKGVTQSGDIVAWQEPVAECGQGFAVGSTTAVANGSKKNAASISVNVPTTTGNNFPVRVLVSVNGEPEKELRGTSKNGVQGSVNLG